MPFGGPPLVVVPRGTPRSRVERFLAEHEPKPEPPKPKVKSKTLHRFRQQQRRDED